MSPFGRVHQITQECRERSGKVGVGVTRSAGAMKGLMKRPTPRYHARNEQAKSLVGRAGHGHEEEHGDQEVALPVRGCVCVYGCVCVCVCG